MRKKPDKTIEGRRNLDMLVGEYGEPDIKLNCKQMARELGCCASIGRYGLKLFPKDPSGKTYKLFQIIPLDGWITDPKEIIESFANDQDFKISYRNNNVYKGDGNDE